jgi:hypothetical protein
MPNSKSNAPALPRASDRVARRGFSVLLLLGTLGLGPARADPPLRPSLGAQSSLWLFSQRKGEWVNVRFAGTLRQRDLPRPLGKKEITSASEASLAIPVRVPPALQSAWTGASGPGLDLGSELRFNVTFRNPESRNKGLALLRNMNPRTTHLVFGDTPLLIPKARKPPSRRPPEGRDRLEFAAWDVGVLRWESGQWVRSQFSLEELGSGIPKATPRELPRNTEYRRTMLQLERRALEATAFPAPAVAGSDAPASRPAL